MLPQEDGQMGRRPPSLLMTLIFILRPAFVQTKVGVIPKKPNLLFV